MNRENSQNQNWGPRVRVGLLGLIAVVGILSVYQAYITDWDSISLSAPNPPAGTRVTK